MVLMISEIWLTDTPRIAGSICLSTRHTPASLRFRRGSTSMPIFFSAGSWYSNCARPPASTPHARAMIGGLKYGVSSAAKAIMATFNRVGVKAGTEKRFQVLRIAPAREDSEISNI